MNNVLEKLFGSSARVKVMKLFVCNPLNIYDKSDIISRTKINNSNANKEIRLLTDVKMIKKKVFYKDGKKTKGFFLSPDFKYLKYLKNLLINSEPLHNQEIAKRFSKTGRLKAVIVAGVFIQNEDSRLDILIAGDEIKESSLRKVVSTIESEIGRELRYTVLSTDDFKYRHSIGDRLIRDVLDMPHEVVVDRIGL